jgi:hypothetical protein
VALAALGALGHDSIVFVMSSWPSLRSVRSAMTDTSSFGAPEVGVAPAEALAAGLVIGADGRARCFWGGSTPDYVAYHDTEWGLRADDAGGLPVRAGLDHDPAQTWVVPSGVRELLHRGGGPLRRPRRGPPARRPGMAKALKKHGFKFVGPTTAYALMQATGMVDDHLAGCFAPPS